MATLRTEGLQKNFDFRFAALPPSVRKASGFPDAESNLKSRLSASASNEANSLDLKQKCGFAERHSLSARTAAKPQKSPADFVQSSYRRY